MTDTSDYLEVLRDLLARGHNFSQAPNNAPGLPLFLLLTGTGRTYFYATLLLHMMSISALALLLLRLNVRTLLVWTFVLLSLLPPYVQNTAYIATEGITSAFLALGFVLISLYVLDGRWPYCLLASLLFVWAGIARPTNLPVPFLLALILLMLEGRRRLPSAALLIAMPVLLFGSYFLSSGKQIQSFDVASLTGYQLSNATVEFYDDIGNPIAREELVKARSELYRSMLPTNFAVWKARPALKQRLGLSDAQLGRFLLGMNLRLIARHPEAYMEHIVQRSSSYWFPYVTKIITARPLLRVPWYILEISVASMFLFELMVLAGLFIGSLIFNRVFEFVGNRATIYGLAIALIFETMAVSYFVTGFGNARYRSATDILILFAAILIADWGKMKWDANHAHLFG